MKELLVLISVFFLVGCNIDSGFDSDTVAAEPAPVEAVDTLPMGTEVMIAGQIYQVFPGDYVAKTTEDAEIRIEHVNGEATSNIELIKGEANLVKKQ